MCVSMLVCMHAGVFVGVSLSVLVCASVHQGWCVCVCVVSVCVYVCLFV